MTPAIDDSSGSLGVTEVPKRVCFNFLQRCNMSCPFCYLSFGGSPSDVSTMCRAVSIALAWGADSITFGGGDPFLFAGFPELLHFTRTESIEGFFIQVDTNAVVLSHGGFDHLLMDVDLLGLPLDGPDARTHDLIRHSRGHFDCVTTMLARAQSLGVPVKVNTVVSRLNVDKLEAELELLSRYDVAMWSLYELWPQIGTPSWSCQDLRLPSRQFLEAAESIRLSCDFAPVEVGTARTRNHRYLFVSDTGAAYTTSTAEPTCHVDLGSVFDGCVPQRWRAYWADASACDYRMRARREAAGKRVPLHISPRYPSP